MANSQNVTPAIEPRDSNPNNDAAQRNIIAGVAGGVAGAAAVPLAAPGILGLVGFSSAGPVAGSLAAVIQSSIGSVAAGSPFAIAQSIAMGGAVPVVGFIIGGAIAAGAAVTVMQALNGEGARGNGGSLPVSSSDNDSQDGDDHDHDTDDEDPGEKPDSEKAGRKAPREDIKARLNRIAKAE